MPRKKKRDPLTFLIYAVVWGLLIMALMHAYAPVIAPDAREPEIRALSQEIITLKPEALRARLAASEKPTLLFVYASWCGYCRQVLPELLKVQQAGLMDHLNLVFLSLDGEKRKLAKYMVDAGYVGRYTPYIIPEWGGSETRRALNDLGSGFHGAIPYIARFDKDNLTGEISGMPSWSEVQNLLQRGSRSAN